MATLPSYEDFDRTHRRIRPLSDTSEEALRARARELYIEEVERITQLAHEKGVSTVDVRIIDAALEIMGRKVPE